VRRDGGHPSACGRLRGSETAGYEVQGVRSPLRGSPRQEGAPDPDGARRRSGRIAGRDVGWRRRSAPDWKPGLRAGSCDAMEGIRRPAADPAARRPRATESAWCGAEAAGYACRVVASGLRARRSWRKPRRVVRASVGLRPTPRHETAGYEVQGVRSPLRGSPRQEGAPDPDGARRRCGRIAGRDVGWRKCSAPDSKSGLRAASCDAMEGIRRPASDPAARRPRATRLKGSGAPSAEARVRRGLQTPTVPDGAVGGSQAGTSVGGGAPRPTGSWASQEGQRRVSGLGGRPGRA